MTLDYTVPKTRMVQLLDLAKTTFGNRDNDGKWIPGKLAGEDHVEERRVWCYFNLPYDCPTYMRVFRRLNVQKPGRKATVVEDLGTTIELACFTFGVNVYIKHTRPTKEAPAKLSIIVEDGDGLETVASYEGAS